MKKLTIAFAIMALVAVNQVSAEMVDIGTGQMEQSEFIALKAIVQGRQTDNAPALSTPLERPERYGMVEMAPADFQALRDQVAGRSSGIDAGLVAKASPMIDLGTGEMPMDEFITLKNMVAGTHVFRWGHLATAQP